MVHPPAPFRPTAEPPLHALLDLIKSLGRPDRLAALAQSMGPSLYVLLFVIVFAETGLVVTPFLPGDSMLFAVGALCATGGIELWVVIPLLIVAAVLGDAVNYQVGYRLGPAVFKSQRSRLFNKQHLVRTQSFYERYGGKTIILARFVPIVRTFAPFVAGIGKMSYARFLAYNVVGAVAWVFICVGAGYFFGNLEFVQKNFELVLIAIILLSVLPAAIEILRERRRAGEAAG
ncbi:MAG: DedA family protein [Polyangiaceae bacterium]|nr:DedA family protein [Polyangiaceae bacterium]